ncbi:MAG: FtsX-like permease family protein [Muribaculaceae bacterium]
MLALKIALRYLFAKKSHRAVNVIAVISMAGVAVATMAIVVVLSVFNGFTDLAHSHLAAIDPDVKLLPRQGKVIASADSLVRVLEGRGDVAAAAPVLQERALLVAGDHQMPVVFKGLDPAKARAIADLDAIVVDGVYAPVNDMPDSLAGMQASVGVAVSLGLRPSPYAAGQLYVPKRKGRINPANPAAAYRALPVAVTGVVQVDQPEYDADFVFIPLDAARTLLDYDGGEGSAVEVKAAMGVKPANLVRDLARDFPDYVVQGRIEQQADTFRMIAVEKWVTFLMLVFILLIAAFNIVSTMSLMVIEKRSDISTLRALGAPASMTRAIFVAEGWLVTVVGGIAGLVLGVGLSLLQEYCGLVKLAADPSALTIDAYPVRVEWTDVASVFLAIIVTGLLIGAISRIFTRKTNN